MTASRRTLTNILLLALAAGCSTTPSPPSHRVQDCDGKSQQPLVVPPGTVHVLVFTSHECPIANAYAPTLRELASTWANAPVRLFLVHVDPDLSATAAREHAAAYELPGTILLDPHHDLARAVHIRRTPEAFVIAGAYPAYRGRIDDQWHALGARSQVVSRHDLRDAVAACLRGERPEGPHPEAVGCLLPEPRP